MKQTIKLNHSTGPIEITIEGSDENSLLYLKGRIEEIFEPASERKSFEDLFGGNFESIFGKGFKL